MDFIAVSSAEAHGVQLTSVQHYVDNRDKCLQIGAATTTGASDAGVTRTGPGWPRVQHKSVGVRSAANSCLQRHLPPNYSQTATVARTH